MFSCNQCVHNLALNVLFNSHDWLVKSDMLLHVWWVWTSVVDLWWGPVNWQQHPHGSPFTHAILCQKSAASETPMGSFGRLPKVSRKTSATTYSTTKNRRRDQTSGWKSWTHTSYLESEYGNWQRSGGGGQCWRYVMPVFGSAAKGE